MAAHESEGSEEEDDEERFALDEDDDDDDEGDTDSMQISTPINLLSMTPYSDHDSRPLLSPPRPNMTSAQDHRTSSINGDLILLKRLSHWFETRSVQPSASKPSLFRDTLNGTQ